MNNLHPVTATAIELLQREARRRGLPMRVTSTYRSIANQRALWLRWLNHDPRVITPAKPGLSTHNYGLGFDAVSPGRQNELIALGRSIGLATIPTDPVHFQILDPADWQAALRLSPNDPIAVLG